MNKLPISNIYQSSLTNFLKNPPLCFNHSSPNKLIILILILTFNQFKKYFPLNYDNSKVKQDFELYKTHVIDNKILNMNNSFMLLHNDIKKSLNTISPILIIPYYLSIEKTHKISLLNYRSKND